MQLVRTRFRKIGVILATVSILGSFGGHWITPKIVVWTLMVIDYGRTTSVFEAIESTLSGKQPCHRCHKLSLAQEAEQKAPPASTHQFKTELFVSSSSKNFTMTLKASGLLPLLPYLNYHSINIPPPTPPPQRHPSLT